MRREVMTSRLATKHGTHIANIENGRISDPADLARAAMHLKHSIPLYEDGAADPVDLAKILRDSEDD